MPSAFKFYARPINMFCALLFVLLFNSHQLFTHANEVTTIANRIPKKSVVARMFSNRTFPRAPTYEQHRKSACQWLKGFKKQTKQCEGRRGFAAVLQNARQLAVNNCAEQFKYDRWNCANKTFTFQDIYRETAFMYAISASAIMFSAAKACNDGKLQRCYCAETPRYPKNGKWQWGGCGDNSKKARKIASKFLQLRNTDDVTTQILNHNMRIGYKTVKENEMKVCTCNGISNSCALKICWKVIKPFSKIVQSLKQKYQTAIKVNMDTQITNSANSSLAVSSLNRLLYLAQSPNFCDSTVGRRCKDSGQCSTLCCGRGHQRKIETTKERCHCRWQQHYLNVTCRVCNVDMEVYYCI